MQHFHLVMPVPYLRPYFLCCFSCDPLLPFGIVLLQDLHERPQAIEDGLDDLLELFEASELGVRVEVDVLEERASLLDVVIEREIVECGVGLGENVESGVWKSFANPISETLLVDLGSVDTPYGSIERGLFLEIHAFLEGQLVCDDRMVLALLRAAARLTQFSVFGTNIERWSDTFQERGRLVANDNRVLGDNLRHI